ncbi:MAG TPA: hypothetical protein VH834_02170, partial [Solirubrobacteraceae bacterium]
ADTVELKVTLPDTALRPAIAALGLDPMEAQVRQVFFFDTPDLALNKAGVVVRARRVQGKGEDSVVKLRPVVPDDLPAELRQSENLVVEVDAMPGGYVCSASLKGVVSTGRVREAARGERPLRKVFSKEQRAFYKDHAPEGVGFDDLATLGPIFVLKLKTNPEGIGRRLVTEMWLYPDGSRVLELSTRCARNEAFQVAAEARAFLTGRGVDLSGEQVTKTRKALEFFANELQAPAA